MKNVAANRYENIGSILDLLFLPVDEVLSLPMVENGSLDASLIILQPGLTLWNVFNFTKKTCEYVQDWVDSENGPIYKQKFVCIVSKDDVNRLNEFYQFVERPCFVIGRDGNDNVRMCGHINIQDERYGMALKVETNVKAPWGSENVHRCTFSLDSSEPAVFVSNLSQLTVYNNSIPIVLLGNGTQYQNQNGNSGN